MTVAHRFAHMLLKIVPSCSKGLELLEISQFLNKIQDADINNWVLLLAQLLEKKIDWRLLYLSLNRTRNWQRKVPEPSL